MISRFQWSPRTSALRAMVHGQPDVSVRFTLSSVPRWVASCNSVFYCRLHHGTKSGCADRGASCPRRRGAETVTANEWKPTACILCECNCGIEIRLGADGRTFERTRGDKAHPASKGYTCE